MFGVAVVVVVVIGGVEGLVVVAVVVVVVDVTFGVEEVEVEVPFFFDEDLGA